MTPAHAILGSIEIKAKLSIVWDMLTNPDKILIYTGSSAKTDWKVGSEIIWEWRQNNHIHLYEGEIIENMKYKKIRYKYRPTSGKVPENANLYIFVTCILDQVSKDKTLFTYVRENIPSEDEKKHMEEYIPSMLAKMKKIAEA